MKTIFLSFIALLFTHTLFAQDNIVLRSGEEIKAKVEEVGIAEIKYRKSDNLTGPLYTIRKGEVLLINYQNGTKDVFSQAPQTGGSAMHHRDNYPQAGAAAPGDYNKYRKLAVKRIVGGAIMTGVGVPTLLTGVGLSIAGFSSFNKPYDPTFGNSGGNMPLLGAGALFTAAGVVLTVLGPLSIKRGQHYRKLAREMKPASMGFTPISDSNLDRYGYANHQNKVGVTFTF